MKYLFVGILLFLFACLIITMCAVVIIGIGMIILKIVDACGFLISLIKD